MSFKWRLKEKMAESGIWRCTDLTKLLNAHGINITSSMVTLIVDRMPERINTKVLDAICDILECTPADILVHIPSGKNAEKLRKAVGDDIGIKPGPKPRKKTNSSDVPDSVLGPKGSVIN
jgi:DNA-binding Xre family transcriptional regulator